MRLLHHFTSHRRLVHSRRSLRGLLLCVSYRRVRVRRLTSASTSRLGCNAVLRRHSWSRTILVDSFVRPRLHAASVLDGPASRSSELPLHPREDRFARPPLHLLVRLSCSHGVVVRKGCIGVFFADLLCGGGQRKRGGWGHNHARHYWREWSGWADDLAVIQRQVIGKTAMADKCVGWEGSLE